MPSYRLSLAIRESQLGADHPDTAASLNDLAGLYYAQGRYSEAEPLLKRSLAIRESQLGTDHPHTAQGLNNLAALYESQGRYSEAEPLLKRSLAIRESSDSIVGVIKGCRCFAPSRCPHQMIIGSPKRHNAKLHSPLQWTFTLARNLFAGGYSYP